MEQTTNEDLTSFLNSDYVQQILKCNEFGNNPLFPLTSVEIDELKSLGNTGKLINY